MAKKIGVGLVGVQPGRSWAKQRVLVTSTCSLGALIRAPE